MLLLFAVIAAILADVDNNNFFLAAKGAVVAACAAYVAAFGYVGVLVVLWALCMVLDWISGTAAAAAQGNWSSSTARAGIWHKGGMIVVVIVAAVADTALSVLVDNIPGVTISVPAVVLPIVLCWYIFTELGSMAENATQMGANVPQWLVQLLAAGRKAVEKGAEELAVDVIKKDDGSTVAHLNKAQLESMSSETLEQLAADMGLSIKTGASKAELVEQIHAVPLNTPTEK